MTDSSAIPAADAASVASATPVAPVASVLGSTIAPPIGTVTPAPVPAIGFVGKQNSGKTVLLEKLIAHLSMRSLHVATLKHHSHAGFDFDIEGKDSWRHRQAGSVLTVIAAPDQMATVQQLSRELDAETIVAKMRQDVALLAEPVDLILVEGYRQGGLPTVELFRAGNPKDEQRDLGGEGNEIVAVVTDIPRIVQAAAVRALPTFGFEDIDALAEFLIGRFLR